MTSAFSYATVMPKLTNLRRWRLHSGLQVSAPRQAEPSDLTSWGGLALTGVKLSNVFE